MAARTPRTDHTDVAGRAFAPVAKLNEMIVGNVERVARFQYELAGDLLQLGLDQLHAAAKARDLPTLLATQREIATRFASQAQARQQALAELATESQADVARWIDDTAATVTGKVA